MFKKLSAALNVIKVLMALVPLVRPLIVQVEVPGFGPEKKDAVLTAVEGTIDILPWDISTDTKETTLKIVAGLIDVIIGVLNLIGHTWISEVSE